jgi:hypothetical protein
VVRPTSTSRSLELPAGHLIAPRDCFDQARQRWQPVIAPPHKFKLYRNGEIIHVAKDDVPRGHWTERAIEKREIHPRGGEVDDS